MANLLPRDITFFAGGDALAKYGTLVRRTWPADRGGEQLKETVTRAGPALGISAGGILVPCGNNVAVIEYLTDPVTGLQQAYWRCEAAATNKLTFPEDLSNAAWTKTQATIPSTNNTSPRNDATASFLREDSSVTVFHFCSQAFSIAVAGNKVGGTRFVKANGRTKLQWLIGKSDLSTFCSVIIDTVAGTVTPSLGGSGTMSFSGILPLAAGWYAVTMYGRVDGATTALVDQNYLMLGGSTSYTGDGASGMFVWGCVATDNTIAGSYWGTAASRVGDTATVPTYDGPGLRWRYSRFLERNPMPNAGAAIVATPPTNADQRWTLDRSATGYRTLHGVAGSSVNATGAVLGTWGQVVETLELLNADGSVTLHTAINGGASVVTGPSAALAFGTTPFGAFTRGLAGFSGGLTDSAIAISRIVEGTSGVASIPDARTVLP